MPRPPTPPPPPEVILAQALTLRAVRSQSFLDFLSDVLVEDAQKGNIPFELWPHLVDLAQSFERNESYIILKARRLGVTWLIAAYVVWKAMTRPGANVIVISKTLDPDGYEFLAHCQFIWDNLPPRRKLRLRSSNLTKLEFISGGSIRVLAPTKDAGRSLSAAVVVVDEAAFHPYAAENYAGYKATTDNGGQVLMVSTSNGPSGFFYQMYQQAKASQLSSYRTRFIAWWYRPMRALRDHRENCGFQVHRTDCTCPLLLSPAGLPQPNYDWLAIEAQEYLSRPSSQGGGSSIDLSREYPSCITAETRVSTKRGLIRADEIQVGDETEDGKIVRHWSQPKSPIYTLMTKKGRILRGTANHPVLTEDGFRHLADIAEGDVVSLRPPMLAERWYRHIWHPVPKVKSEIVVDERMGLFLGFYMGDGSWHNGTLSIACNAKDEDVVEYVADLVEEVVGVRPGIRTTGTKGGCREVRVGNLAFKQVLDQLGCLQQHVRESDGQAGAYYRKICVPEAIWKSPPTVVREFLRGLFESDGAISHSVKFGSKHLSFVQDVQLLLLHFGITSRISKKTKPANGGTSFYTFYEMEMTKAESVLFMKEIGFIGARRKNGVNSFYNGPLGRSSFPIVMQDEVLSVTVGEPEVTYDVTVEDTHTFSANGIVTHNSEDAAWTAASGLVYGLSEADGKMIFLRTQHPEGNLSPDPTPFTSCRWRYAAVDYGGGDPTAILIAGKLPSGRVHVYNVFKRTGDVPVSEISNYLSSFDPQQTLFDAILCPKDGPNTTAELRHLGWPVYSARQARKEGITSTQQFLKSRRLTINPDTCEDLLREFESYYWQYRRDPSTGEKYATRTPHDHHGDLLDALRAVVMEIEASELTSYDLPDAIMKTR